MRFSLDKRTIFLSICTIGCCIQLFTVTHNFLMFKVRTEIIHEYPTMIEIPEIDFIIPLANVINMSELYLRHPKQMSFICSQVTDKINLTIKSINDFDKYCSSMRKMVITTTDSISPILTIGDIEQLTTDPKSMIKEIYIDDTRRNLLLSNECTIQKYFSGWHIFMRVSCRNKSQPIIKKIIQTQSANAYLLCLSLQSNYSFGFNLSPANSFLASRFRQYIVIDYKKDSVRYIYAKFRRVISKSLPWPYATNCQHYDKSKTLITCINDNLISHPSEPSIYIDHLVIPGDYPGYLKFANDGAAEFDRKVSHIIFQECSKLIYQPECNSVVYTTHAQEHSESLDNDSKNKVISLCLEAHLDADTIYRSVPENTFIQYLIYVSSTLGIWFGISIYGNLNGNLLTKLLTRLYPRKLLPTKKNEFQLTPVIQLTK